MANINEEIFNNLLDVLIKMYKYLIYQNGNIWKNNDEILKTTQQNVKKSQKTQLE